MVIYLSNPTHLRIHTANWWSPFYNALTLSAYTPRYTGRSRKQIPYLEVIAVGVLSWLSRSLRASVTARYARTLDASRIRHDSRVMCHVYFRGQICQKWYRKIAQKGKNILGIRFLTLSRHEEGLKECIERKKQKSIFLIWVTCSPPLICVFS